MELALIFILFFVIGISLLILNIATSIWAYRDAIKNGRSQEFAIIVLVATLFFPIIGFIVYLFIRNS